MNARRREVLWTIVTVAVCILRVITIGSCQIDCSGLTRFLCSDGTCISKAKECNGKRDCAGGEDERECYGREICRPRDENMAELNKYSCVRRCSEHTTCSWNRGEECLCDDECGISCVRPSKPCTNPPQDEPSLGSYYVKRHTARRHRVIFARKPYLFGDVAYYRCERGLTLRGPLPRCQANGLWSNETPQCVDTRCPGDPPLVLHSTGGHVARNVRGRQRIIRQPPYKTGDIFNYVCELGKALEGHLPTCINGNWSQELPKCIDYNQCGQSGQTAALAKIGRAVGGEDAMEDTWPWFALITKKSSTPEESLERDNLKGGGTIINKHWVLTAAHVLHRLDFNDYVIFVGLSERPSEHGFVKSSVKTYSITEYVEHPYFDVATSYDSDIALIKLGQKLDQSMQHTSAEDVAGLTFGPSIRAICLPGCTTDRAESNQNHLRCPWSGNLLPRTAYDRIMIGFGHTDAAVGQVSDDDFNPPKMLQQAAVKIKEPSWCSQQLERARTNETGYSKRRLHMTNKMICCDSADRQSGSDACRGDSGGPLMKEMVDDETRTSYWVQIGIVSFGFGCASQYPGYYTKVETFTSWIQGVISDRRTVSECTPPDSPVNGNVTWDNGRRGSTACYSCFEGYTLVGTKCRTCNADRRWEGRTPSCEDYNQCGQSGEKMNVHAGTTGIGLVVGGADVMEGTWPWFAQITRKSSTPKRSLDDHNLKGGGSIINKDWILTTAFILHERDLNEYVVFVGLNERPSDQEFVKSSAEMYSIAEFVQHPDFNVIALHDNDIGLIKLGQKLDQSMQHTNADDVDGLRFGPSIRAICLPGCTTTLPEFNQNHLRCPWSGNVLDRVADDVIIVGFGLTSRENLNSPKKLQQATVRIKEPSWCQQQLERAIIVFNLPVMYFTENMICCGSDRRNRTDACVGDAGGPVMKETVDEQTGTSYWVQIGITSFGLDCGSEYPGYYTKVERFTPWIRDIISARISVWQCDFETQCDILQIASDDFDWIIHNGSTPSENTGPSTDHTHGDTQGHYMYIEASSPRQYGEIARMATPLQSSINDACLEFYYHMFGVGAGSLSAVLSVESGREVRLWNKFGSQENLWQKQMMEFHSDERFRLIFEAVRGSDFHGDLALDDIVVKRGKCPGPVFECDFEEVSICGFVQDSSDDFDWDRNNGATSSSDTGPMMDHTSRTLDGYYMYIESSSPRVVNERTRLVGPVLIDTRAKCLEFFYHMSGVDINTLNVYTKLAEGGMNKLVWSKVGPQGNDWNVAKVEITSTSSYRLVFEAIRGNDFHGDIAIDDITLNEGTC